jgi:hypothetical protein
MTVAYLLIGTSVEPGILQTRAVLQVLVQYVVKFLDNTNTNTLLSNAYLGSQGTWRFMAADLITNSRIDQTFVHDLESAFHVLLYHAICNMNHSLTEGQAANMVHDFLNARRYAENGGYQKFFFMSLPGAIDNYDCPSNAPFTKLLSDLHDKHLSRYILISGGRPGSINPKVAVSAIALAQAQPPSFVTPDVYWENDFRHDIFIDIIDQALGSDGWPEDDRAIAQRIIRSNSSIARSASSSKRSRTWSEGGSKMSTTGRSYKRLNLDLDSAA